MFLTIGNILEGSQLRQVCQNVDALEWRDGAKTAGPVAKRVKQNLQAELKTPQGRALQSELSEAIRANPVFAAWARPARMSPLLLSRTEAGGGYGAHVDNAVMGTGEKRMRTDLSFTLFLSEPETYEGGALMLDLPGGAQSFRPAAGDLVLYPSTLIHQVEPVTAGVRLVAVGWVQSEIRDGDKRQLLFDLEQVRMAQRARADMDAPEMLVLDKVFSNLLRFWSDT